MFFFFKKILSAFLMPLSFSLLIYFFGLILLIFRKKKTLSFFVLSLAFMIQIIFCTQPFSTYFIKTLENNFKNEKNIIKNNFSTTHIAILGGGHVSGHKVPHHSQITDESLKRFLQGYLLYKKHPKLKMIFSGYNGSDLVSHAKVLEKMALIMGLKKNDFITFKKPRDTFEEDLAIKNVVKDNYFFLVTSASHMKRSLMIFREQGMKPIASPGHFYLDNLEKHTFKEIMPQARYLKMSERALHEYIGIIWWDIRTNFFKSFNSIH